MMKKLVGRVGIGLIICLLLSSTVVAQETETTTSSAKLDAPPEEGATAEVVEGEAGFEKYLKFNGLIQSVFVFRNDYDFDSTPRYYDVEGQTVGILGTFFKQQLTLFPAENLRVFWELELGLNLWSRHNPDQYETGNFDTFKIAHRELYVEGQFFDKWLGFKVGYQFFDDPTRLFIGHWIGAANVSTDARWAKFTFTVAQLPGQTYEGITLQSNNFRHDTFLYGLRVDVPLDRWQLAVSALGLYDGETVGQTLNLFTPSLRAEANYGWVKFGLDLAMQVGETQDGAAFGSEQTLAWALQAFADFNVERLSIQFNQLVLSADDRYDRNGTNGAFFYSGKSRSRTLILSEDEIRDQGYNLDELLAQRRNSFNLVRAGLSLTDVTVSYNIHDIFVPALILGAGFVLEPGNAMDSQRVGIETDLDLEFRYKDVLSFHLIGGLLFPGGAAAAYVNMYDLHSTNTQYMLEASLAVAY
jgi:hypothetical protein